MSTRIELATPQDEKDLRQLLLQTSMPGKIRLQNSRDPHFFNSLDVLGKYNQILVTRNISGNIVGSGIRSIKPMYINNEIQQIGYLSNLRLEKKYRGKRFLVKGFQYLHELHQDKQCPFYLTSIMADNENAKTVLHNRRGLLPVYHPWGKINTYLINHSRSKIGSSHIKIEFASPMDKNKILKFLNQEGKEKQFFPYYMADDLREDGGLLRGLSYQTILVAKQNQQIIATLALWNQNPFKQIVIHSYHPIMQWLRPIYNLYSKMSHKPYLPKPGNLMDFNYAAIVCVKNNDTKLFQHILSVALSYSTKLKKSFVALGLHETDPLNEVVKHFRYQLMQSYLYLVSFPSQKMDFSFLKKKVPYLELGAL